MFNKKQKAEIKQPVVEPAPEMAMADEPERGAGVWQQDRLVVTLEAGHKRIRIHTDDRNSLGLEVMEASVLCSLLRTVLKSVEL